MSVCAVVIIFDGDLIMCYIWRNCIHTKLKEVRKKIFELIEEGDFSGLKGYVIYFDFAI